MFLDWLLLARCHDEAARRGPSAVLAELAAAAPQRVCSKTFSHGDVIWKCRTCQVGDDTCVVCQACFQDADHEGHDVSFYISWRQNFFWRQIFYFGANNFSAPKKIGGERCRHSCLTQKMLSLEPPKMLLVYE